MASERLSELLATNHKADGICRILSLDGGSAKGFYTLGVLKDIEVILDCPLYKRFDLIFGSSTGAIIASLLAFGYNVDDIHQIYKEHVPAVMRRKGAFKKTTALEKLASQVFGDETFENVKTGVGIVATRWLLSSREPKAPQDDASLRGLQKSGKCPNRSGGTLTRPEA